MFPITATLIYNFSQSEQKERWHLASKCFILLRACSLFLNIQPLPSHYQEPIDTIGSKKDKKKLKAWPPGSYDLLR